ncbi:putative M18 family aminopeptidase 2 [Corynebacterium capitovis DSM 44611]|uniref:M18 family aminopeptidase n=1 Tax=Corynebacterium capitovis TaxID=131081 RepID=UPI000361F46C|nr:M18 family aminopeptidase [Corynebacterium capitovis]WKD57670.1 putative M18 family aminopeptidase 2 [Corynebacterium capitovis DSM 44611]
MNPRDFISFLSASPSAFHAADVVGQTLVDASFAPDSALTPGGHVLVRGGAVLAWWVPDNPRPRLRVVGSHTDSPGFMAKPDPQMQREGLNQVAVEIYGGPILHSWFDRDLAFAGRIALADGSLRLVHTDPVARIPNLAIHLTRPDSAPLNRQTHTQPVLGTKEPFLEVVARAAGVDAGDIIAHELVSADTQRGEMLDELLAAGRLDNLSSVWASLSALLSAKDSARDVLVLAAFNHEEVGSASPTGAGGPLLERIVTKLAASLGDVDDVLSDSLLVSADAAHAAHPNYPEKHDPTHRPRLGGGPVVKVNANQRYASDAATEAAWIRACRAAGVPHQTFVGNNDVACGSTIGPIAATRLGIPTVDVGIALLSMHSARELCSVQDLGWFTDALTAFYAE